MLTAFYLSKFEPEGNAGCHVNVVILDSGNTPAQHAQCHTTPAARFLEISNISGLFALLFFAIRICGLGLWPDSTTACSVSYYTCCTSSSFHFLSGVMPCGQGIPYIQDPNAALKHEDGILPTFNLKSRSSLSAIPCRMHRISSDLRS